MIHLADLADLSPDRPVLVRVSGEDVLLCRVGDQVFAAESICPHAGRSLSGGKIKGSFLLCPFHGARFDLRTGKSPSPLVPRHLKTCALPVVDGQVGCEDAATLVLGLGGHPQGDDDSTTSGTEHD